MTLLDWLLHPSDPQADDSRVSPLQIPMNGYAKKVIQAAINDESELSGMTKAGVAQAALSRSLIGADGIEGSIIESMYYDAAAPVRGIYPGSMGVKRAFESFFDHCFAAGVSGIRADKQGKPVVEAMLTLCNNHRLRLHEKIPSSDPRCNLEKRDLPSFLESLQKWGEGVCAEELDAILPSATNPNPLVAPFVELVLSNWNVFRKEGLAAHWRMLVYLASATEPWDETPADRRVLRDALWQSSNERVQLDRLDELRSLEEQRKAMLIKYPLLGGDFLLAPLGWEPVQIELAPTKKYAGAVAVSRVSGAPTFIIFSDKPIDELSPDEIEEHIAAAGRLWPDGSLIDIYRSKKKEGGKGPLVALFPIPEAGEYPFGDPPGHAEIFRVGN